jgi:hypothetical protein
VIAPVVLVKETVAALLYSSSDISSFAVTIRAAAVIAPAFWLTLPVLFTVNVPLVKIAPFCAIFPTVVVIVIFSPAAITFIPAITKSALFVNWTSPPALVISSVSTSLYSFVNVSSPPIFNVNVVQIIAFSGSKPCRTGPTLVNVTLCPSALMPLIENPVKEPSLNSTFPPALVIVSVPTLLFPFKSI